jgi:predicted nucleic acid-binding protein
MGVGYVDCHLLTSTALANARLWTADKRLAAAALKMNLSI